MTLPALKYTTEKPRVAGSPRSTAWPCPVDRPGVWSLKSYWFDQSQGDGVIGRFVAGDALGDDRRLIVRRPDGAYERPDFLG